MSKRKDVINFFETVCGTTISLTVITECSDLAPVPFEVVVLDATLIVGKTAEVYRTLELYSDRFICLLPSDSSPDLREYVTKTFLYVLSFPIEEAKFKKYLDKVQNKLIKKIEYENHPLLEDDTTPDSVLGFFCGSSSKIKAVRKKIFAAARLRTPVLLLGETGTGKSKTAELIHILSGLKGEQPVAKSFTMIPSSLAESTFFGHAKGAFTDADSDKIGLIELADGSTLFLDELGAATLEMQGMLNTVLDNGNYTKVGSSVVQHSDVRFIFATNADLNQMIAKGTFRKELYYRIYDNTIILPSLRERKEDIPEIVDALLLEKNYTIQDEAMKKLIEHDWPGNLREFNKVMESAIEDTKDNVIRADNIKFGDISFLR